MTWVRLDETFARHPKVVAAGPLGMAMHVAALCYCNQYLTDGFLPERVVVGLLVLDGVDVDTGGGYENATWQLVVQGLTAAGLWEKARGGWRIHDFHDYQPSKADVLELREARSEAGRKGGLANGLANAKAKRKQTSSRGGSKTEAKSYPVPVPVKNKTLDLPRAPVENSKFPIPALRDMP